MDDDEHLTRLVVGLAVYTGLSVSEIARNVDTETYSRVETLLDGTKRLDADTLPGVGALPDAERLPVAETLQDAEMLPDAKLCGILDNWTADGDHDDVAVVSHADAFEQCLQDANAFAQGPCASTHAPVCEGGVCKPSPCPRATTPPRLRTRSCTHRNRRQQITR